MSINSRRTNAEPDFRTGDESPEAVRSVKLARFAWLPIPLFTAAIIIARAAGLRESYASEALTLVLSLTFYTLVSLGTIFLMGRNFLKSGAPGLLLLECGVILWCLGGTAGDAVSHGDANVNVTIFNTAILLSGLCNLAGAALLLQPKRALRAAPLWLGAGWLLSLGLLYLIARAALAGWLPVFFVPGHGGTLVRQAVLVSAIAVSALSSRLVLASRRGQRTPFASWYGMALLLLAVGLFGVLIQLSLGSVVNWLGRSAQWLGGLYLLLAAFLHESNLPLFPTEKESRPDLYRYGVAVAIVLVATAVRLAFLPALEARFTFVTFFPAVTLAALYGGLGPGLLATVLSGLAADYFWIEPFNRFGVVNPTDCVGLALFALSGVMICLVIEAMHRSGARLVFQQSHLEELVKSRTADLEREIADRKEVEETLSLNNQILAGINEVLNAALGSRTEEELGVACLEVAERITGSRFGFIGEVNPEGLEDIAISNPGWDACKILDIGGHRRPPANFKIHGIYGRVLSDGKALYTNDPEHHPDSIGLPPGHPPLTSFLGVPLIRDGRVIGMISVGNREGGYRKEDQEALETLAPAIVEAFLRKRAERELQKARDELEQRVEERTLEVRRQADLLDLAHDAIIVRDLDGRIIFWNMGAEEMYGWSRVEAIGRITHELLKTEFPVSPEEIMDIASREGKWEGELIHTGKHGGKMTVFSRWTLRQGEPGKPSEILEINLDVTRRKIAEDQLRQAHKMEAIGTLAGGIAHDFNNILAAIIGFTEMVMDDVEDRPLVGKNLQNVMKSAMRARELVKQILTFSRKTSYERSPLALAPVVKETVQLLRASIPKTIDIRFSLRSSSDMVLASPVEIQQILMNLATNASLAMQEKGGMMEISLADADFGPDSLEASGECVKITVSDTGCGMSPELVKRIFEPFYTTREVGKGSGMGLAVVYGIVKDLQGTITVESEEGAGSTFRVFLPRAETDSKAEGPKPSEIVGGKERILFVDDEEMLAEWGKATLERLGYRVIAVTDSTEALKAFSADPTGFDLVITDHAMPQMAGSQLSLEILKMRNDIPIILCTGHTETLTPEDARRIGIREFILKPLSRQELAEAVRRVLDAKD